MEEHTSNVDDIYLAALERETIEERSAYLDGACVGNPELRRRVERLLEAQLKVGSFLESPAPEICPTSNQPIAEKPGAQIGPYKLLQQIGEGGMGTVFMAEQTEPVQRKVALKIIKPGMDSRQIIARFEAERQALALMDHPNIAKILDAGATENGRPYFVMELVKGVPINQYCDEHRLNPRQRLELLITVCQAVQHAHQKGIIHRDLKPTNVLVADYDDRPAAKIIDFGVAKAVGQQLTNRTMFTEFGQVVGTIEYMSPEQAKLNQLDIDTRTDIYSLGVLLYELLSGSTPFDKERLRSAAFDEMLRIIREEEPPKPSTRLSTSQSLPSIAANRQLEPKKLTTTVSGDLDWIVMKSLEKDRARRYDTATGLAEDIQRYLTDQPVEARRPTRGYRLRKFIRRNKVGVLAGSTIALALALGAVVSTWQALRADREAKIASTQEQIARTEAARSAQVAQFLKDTLAAAGPGVARGRDATLLREILDKTAARVQRNLQDQPEVQGDLWSILGTTYFDIGDYSQVVSMSQNAVDSYRLALGPESSKLAVALGNLGWFQSHTNDVTRGKASAELGLNMARKCGDPESVAVCLEAMALSQRNWSMSSVESQTLWREAVAIRRKLANNPVALADCLVGYGLSLGDTEEAESLAREALVLYRQYVEPDNPKIARSLMDLGQILMHRDQLAEAETVLREMANLYSKVYDKNNPYQGIGRFILAEALARRGKWDEAEPLIHAEFNASATNNSGFYYYYLGLSLQSQGKLDEAVAAFGKATEHLPQHLYLCLQLGNVLQDLGRFDEAGTAYGKVIEIEPDNPEGYVSLAWLLATSPVPQQSDPTRAVELATRAVELAPQNWVCWNTLGVARYRSGQRQTAIDAIKKSRELHDPEASQDFFLAMAQQQLGHKDEAHKWYDQGVEWMDKNKPKNQELVRFRREAAVLLGITVPNSSTDSTPPDDKLPIPKP